MPTKINNPITIENEPDEINVSTLVSLTARLAQLLAEEADLLDEMKIKKIPALQEEKNLITNALEMQVKRIHKNPALLENITAAERDELAHVSDVFNAVMDENHARLMTARAVNLQMVTAIRDLVREATQKSSYTPQGVIAFGMESLSVTLNERV